MVEILIAGFFLILCFIYTITAGVFETWYVIAILLAILSSALILMIENQKWKTTIYLIYDLAAVYSLPCNFFFPVLMLAFKEDYRHPAHLPTFAVLICHSYGCYQLGFVFLLAIAALICRQCLTHYETLLAGYRLQRDTLAENALLLKQRNQYLAASRENEIQMAALNERGRISRDIHDSVGHLLSSSLLQTGAIDMLNQQENLKEPIRQLKNTLKQGIENTRESVHQLYDTSLDLNFALAHLSKELPQQVAYTYQISSELSNSVKRQLLAIFQEAIQNILKHSNATTVHLRAAEHPSFLQFEIADNGTNIVIQNGGIGLENIEQRIREMGGHLTIETKQGFRIFFTIPKEENL